MTPEQRKALVAAYLADVAATDTLKTARHDFEAWSFSGPTRWDPGEAHRAVQLEVRKRRAEIEQQAAAERYRKLVDEVAHAEVADQEEAQLRRLPPDCAA